MHKSLPFSSEARFGLEKECQRLAVFCLGFLPACRVDQGSNFGFTFPEQATHLSCQEQELKFDS